MHAHAILPLGLAHYYVQACVLHACACVRASMRVCALHARVWVACPRSPSLQRLDPPHTPQPHPPTRHIHPHTPPPFARPPPQTRYVRTSRELKRLDSLAMSPIFGHFGETLAVSGRGVGGGSVCGVCVMCVCTSPTSPHPPHLTSPHPPTHPPTRLTHPHHPPAHPPPHATNDNNNQGLVTVRAFRQQAPFEARNAALLDASNRAYWPGQASGRGRGRMSACVRACMWWSGGRMQRQRRACVRVAVGRRDAKAAPLGVLTPPPPPPFVPGSA